MLQGVLLQAKEVFKNGCYTVVTQSLLRVTYVNAY